MDRANVESLVIDAVRQVQESSGRAVGSIGSNTCPLRDVDGFDSHSGIEASVMLSASLGCMIPDEVFVPVGGRRPLTVNEIADNVCEHMSVGSKRK